MTKSPRQRIYRPWNRLYWFLAAPFFIIFATAGYLLLIDAFIMDIVPGGLKVPIWQLPFFILGVVASTIFIWVSYYQIRYRRLVISSAEVCYHTFGYAICSSWENIKRIDPHPKTNSGAGFILFQPSTIPNKRLGLLGFIMTPQSPSDTFIPLFPFIKYWTDGELQRDIKRYAPHLLESLSGSILKMNQPDKSSAPP